MSAPMRILLLGKNGQVGWELQRALAPLGELIALDRQLITWRGQTVAGDLSQLEALAAAVDHIAPSVIVNAAAYTAVDKAESEPELADRINHHAVAQLATWATAHGALLVHYSTDYVFDGSGNHAWVETDGTGPLNTYGRTKLAGEEAIRASGCAHFVFRTSWVYGLHGQNFAKTMLRLAQTRQAAAGAALTSTSLRGTYHLAPAGETTWQAYAQCVLDEACAAGVALRARQAWRCVSCPSRLPGYRAASTPPPPPGRTTPA